MSAASLAIATTFTLALSLALPWAVRPLLMRLGIMDIPNERSSHERPVLRGLGLAVLVALAFGAGAVLLLEGPLAPQFLIVMSGSVAAGVLGLAEDLWGLSVKIRSVLLLLLAASVAGSLLFLEDRIAASIDVAASVVVQFFAGAPLTELPVWGLVILALYAVFFISSYINVANFMDGLNGISGFHGVIAGLTFAAAGWFTGLSWLLCAGLLLAVAFGGFLPWNLSKPGAFLGDVGSYLLGGATAVISFAAFVSGVPLLATIGPMVIPFGDVGVTLVKRVRAGYSWDEPHKEHAYQRIQQLGFTHVQASGLAAACTAAASVLGLVSIFTGPWLTLGLLVLGLAVVVLYVRIPALLDVPGPRGHRVD